MDNDTLEKNPEEYYKDFRDKYGEGHPLMPYLRRIMGGLIVLQEAVCEIRKQNDLNEALVQNVIKYSETIQKIGCLLKEVAARFEEVGGTDELEAMHVCAYAVISAEGLRKISTEKLQTLEATLCSKKDSVSDEIRLALLKSLENMEAARSAEHIKTVMGEIDDAVREKKQLDRSLN